MLHVVASPYRRELDPLPYYYLFHETITDMHTFQKYLAIAGPTVGQFGGKALAVCGFGGDVSETLERTPQYPITVLLEFESRAAAERWYTSPEYQAVVGLRIDATDGWAIGLPGVEPSG